VKRTDAERIGLMIASECLSVRVRRLRGEKGKKRRRKEIIRGVYSTT